MKRKEPEQAGIGVYGDAIIISEPRIKCVLYRNGSGYVMITGKDADGHEIMLHSTAFDLEHQEIDGRFQYLGKTRVYIKDIPAARSHIPIVVGMEQISPT